MSLVPRLGQPNLSYLPPYSKPFKSLGVPYHSWRITHARHHASTAHLTADQVFVPPTRAQLRLPAFNPSKEDLAGSTVSEEVQEELRDALGDSPLGAAIGAFSYLVSDSSDTSHLLTAFLASRSQAGHRTS